MIGHQLLVVADAHLSPAAPADEEAFLDFLDQAPRLGDSLLLAGDIFDFWFTYRHVVPRACMRVTARIIEMGRRFPTLMLGGNHDRWGDTFWSVNGGISFDRHQLAFAVGSGQVVALHGDGLVEEQWSSSALNRALDTRFVIGLFDALPPVLGFKIARRLGHNPAAAAARADLIERAAIRQAEYAERRLRDQPGIGTLIMAHTHRAALREVAPHRWYVNPGAWLGEHRYAVVTESGARLESYR